MASTEQNMKGDIVEFAVQMKKMVNCRDHSDLKFLIGPNRKPVYAHRCILASRCAVFKAMFAEQALNAGNKSSAGDRDVPLVLSDMSPDVFLAMLEFIYTNCVTLSSKTATDVLATALEYGLDELQRLCCDYLIGHLTVSNACDIMQAAVTFGQDDMKGKALVFIEQNTANVFKSKSFQEMSSESLAIILQSDSLIMDELDIYRAVKEWATVNSVVLGKHVSEVGDSVVRHVRFPLLSPEELASLENENKKDKFIPVNLFAVSWRFHALKSAEKGNPQTTRRKGTNPRETHKFLDISSSTTKI